MELDEFKYKLVNLLNEYGEDAFDLSDMEIHDVQDQVEIETADGSRFLLSIQQIE